MTDNDNNLQETEEHGNEKTEEAQDEDIHRNDPRRTLKDRRSHWKHPNYKGPQRRYHLRRLNKARRAEEEEPEDDLGKHIP